MLIEWKQYFDNDCKGEDMWGHYPTANGSVYLVVDGASNHDGTRTGGDVIRLIHKRFREESTKLVRSSDLKKLLYSINEESSRVNEGAYAAVAGILHRAGNLYAFGAGDVSIIAKKVNEKLIQVLPLDLNMQREEAEQRAKAEIGHTVNNINVTEENYTQRIEQYMKHGLSNAVGLGDEFFLHDKYFDAKADTAMVIATDGVTDPFMSTQSTAGNIHQGDAEKLYEIFASSSNAKEAVANLENVIWDTQISEKRRIKPDDRTALFLYISAENATGRKKKNFQTMSNKLLAQELLKRIEEHKNASLDVETTISIFDLDSMTEIAKELSRKLNKGG